MFVKKQIKTSVFDNEADKNGNRFGNSSFKDFFNPKKLGLEQWKPTMEANNRVDVIPYNASANNPLVVAGKAAEGDVLYNLDIYVHKGIGPSGSNIACLKQYNKNCPLCREASKYFNLGTEEGKKKGSELAARRRIVYVIRDVVSGKYGYWDTGYKSVAEKLVSVQKSAQADGGGLVNPYDWENGKTIKFYGKKSVFKDKSFAEPDQFAFEDRAPLSDEVLSHSVDLSDTVTMYTEEEMENILAGNMVSPAADQSNTQEVSQPTSAPANEPVAQSTPSFNDMPPAQQPAAASASSEPVVAASPDTTCPHGHKWGEADSYPECAQCPVWEKCLG